MRYYKSNDIRIDKDVKIVFLWRRWERLLLLRGGAEQIRHLGHRGADLARQGLGGSPTALCASEKG